LKKSIIFLINGLGIEKPGSYSISLDQDMPNLARTNNILNANISNNQVYQEFTKNVSTPDSKLHVFLEPTTNRIVEAINDLINNLQLDKNKKVYLHLLLPQLTINDYKKLIDIVNYIKYHINERITVGFVIGKEYISDNLTQDEMKQMEKLFFFCSAERWIRTDEKLNNLKEANVIPCKAPGFCANNDCFIKNGDTILFFNTRRADYDKFIKVIYENAKEVLKTENVNISVYSL